MSDQYGGPGPADDRPGPYRGVFGSSGQPSQPSSPQPPSPYGGRPGPYGGSFGRPNPYSYQQGPAAPPKQVTVAATISLALGGLCILVGVFTVVFSGKEISKALTGSEDSQGLVIAVVLVCAVAYILPAIFLRKRRPWARIMLMVVAAFGIAGGVTALPGSILGLALHVILLVLMLQQPTKLWFQTSRR